MRRRKSVGMAYFLLFFLWPTGAHNFYLGRIWQGFAFIAGYVLWGVTYAALLNSGQIEEAKTYLGVTRLDPLTYLYGVLFVAPMLIETLLLKKRVVRYNRNLG